MKDDYNTIFCLKRKKERNVIKLRIKVCCGEKHRLLTVIVQKNRERALPVINLNGAHMFVHFSGRLLVQLLFSVFTTNP